MRKAPGLSQERKAREGLVDGMTAKQQRMRGPLVEESCSRMAPAKSVQPTQEQSAVSLRRAADRTLVKEADKDSRRMVLAYDAQTTRGY